MQLRLGLALLATFTVASCTRSSASLYRQADLQPSADNYRIVAGTKVVLERCSRTVQPYPDAGSSYCIAVALEQNQVTPGAVVRLVPASVFLWQRNGPSHNLTRSAEGELRILGIGPDSVRAALNARTGAQVAARWQWAFEGNDRYVRSY
jgi:hypothetical protein